ncbi:NB-ARC domain, LRR domain containing protein [Parasponia andersonii]|uniref:NB-ARC domain, LRR domain containing protein n=1 Tax=Parasponia andersonii TaxID=3476 RepID=A0A2P5ATA9_PARAD|nr:NB-ARC domain, LRR domain containing protein [Parasponia andersonii]
MAEQIVLSPVLQVVLDKIASPTLEMLSNIWNLRGNLEKLQLTLPMVQALLEDAESKQASNGAVKVWLSKLKDIAYDAEDLLLDLTERADSYSTFQRMLNNADQSDQVKEMIQSLEMITDEGLRLNLKEGSMVQRDWDRRETSSFVIESEVYGREEDKARIIELLLFCEEANQGGEVSCIPIVGMGGIGKTTLAQLAYNNQKVAQHFDVKIWVFASEHFNAKKILTTVVESLIEDKCECSGMDALHSIVWRLLHKKRYLIVLDDVWTEDQNDWDKLKPLFRSGLNGSKILVTTRSVKVALTMDSPAFPYYLEGLSEDACWSLFLQRTFHRGEEEKHPTLLPIGQEIVRKCGGVALAAKTLGSLMRFKREAREWLVVRDSELWNLDECESGILPALRLSYSHLPLHLKRCFSFCSIFPRNYQFKKEKLISLWMAEGLVGQSSKGRKEPEDIGNDYFNDLLWMSFFQEIKQCEIGAFIGYKMHDVIYDLAQSIVGSEYAKLESHFWPPYSFKQVRHSSIVCDFNSPVLPEVLYEARHLRTLLLFSGGNFIETPHDLYSKFRYLLVLDLSGSGLVTLNGSIGSLFFLRYLDLSYTSIKKLPRKIEYLKSLQTLNLINCYELEALPNLLKLRKLRHLNNAGCEALTTTLPSSLLSHSLSEPELHKALIKSFRNYSNEIQTLSLFVIGGVLDMAFLGLLNLRGSLKITQLQNVHTENGARIAELKRKEGIKSLGLYWGNDEYYYQNINLQEEYNVAGFQKRRQFHSSSPSEATEFDASIGEKVLQHLQPHENLTRLLIKGYPGARFPHWVVPYLNAVDLIDCNRVEYLPTLGNLHYLTSLTLCAMPSVKRIGVEFYSEGMNSPFPVLKELVLMDFPNLEEWSNPDGGEAFPSLSKLILNKCPQLTVMPQILSIEHLELRDCSSTLVHSFQNLTSLKTLLIEKVEDLLCFSGIFPASNSCLTSLEIKSCPQLRNLPSHLESLTAMKALTIRWCEELSFLPQGLQNLDALESLEIGDCHNLVSLTEFETRGLSNLRTLSIENCNKLTSMSMGFQYLTSLENLTIMYCPSLGELPRGFEYLSSLRSLTILSCPQLISLPEKLQNLRLLQSLEIRSCPGLNDLPEWIEKLVALRSLAISNCHNIKFLPQGIRSLTALQHLSIQDCPQLMELCRPQTGEDWRKIVHIPFKHIGSSEQSQPSEAQ